MLHPNASRRKFLVGAIAFSGLAACTRGSSPVQLSTAFNQPSDQIDQGTWESIVRMARLLYPHDAISDEVYVEVLNQALASTAEDEGLADTLKTTEETLNAQQSGNFIDVAEEDQIAALQAIESSEEFIVIQQSVRSHLYNHPVVWEHIGYEGPSYQQGGYLNRGAGEIDWLPEKQ